MPRCVECWYAIRTTVATYEPIWTCMHPVSMSSGKVGYPVICQEMRQEKSACGPEGALFLPKGADGPESALKFKQ